MSGQSIVAEINALLPDDAPRLGVGTELHVAQLRLLAFIAQQVAELNRNLGGDA